MGGKVVCEHNVREETYCKECDEEAGKVLCIKFPTREQLLGFAGWLCGSGEQHYWQWMEDEEPGPVEFNYHSGPNREFMENNIILTEDY